MKTAAITGAVLAALAAGAIATPSFARDPCQQRKHDNGTAGALLGGLAGAVIGSNAAHHGGRTGGTIIGGVAGAAIGNSIGRSGTKCDGYAYYNNGYHDRYGRWHYYSNSYNSYYDGGNSYNGYYDGRYGYNNYYDNGYYYPPNNYDYYPY